MIRPEEFKKILETLSEDSNFYLPLMIGYYTGLASPAGNPLTVIGMISTWESRTYPCKKDGRENGIMVDVRNVEQKGKKEEVCLVLLEHRKQSIPSVPSNLRCPL